MSKIIFKYNLKKDIENFLTVSQIKKINPSSLFLQEKRFTKYKEYFEKCGPILNEDKLKEFIKKHIENGQIDIEESLEKIKNQWSQVDKKFWMRAEKIFQANLPMQKITAYLSTNDVCSYNIKNNYFFICLESSHSNLTIMHELWHFFTWYSLGEKLIKDNKISQREYYDLKESLTEILNIEFKDLLKDKTDKGYSPHQKTREKIRKLWPKHHNIHQLITELLKK